jgi:DNA-binding MarR family transcriptional regulator
VADLFRRFDSVFFEKTRLSIMAVLYQEEKATFNTLKKRLGASDGAVYTHLERLVGSGYAHKKKEIAGTQVQTVYFPTQKGKSRFREYLQLIESLLREAKKGDERQ